MRNEVCRWSRNHSTEEIQTEQEKFSIHQILYSLSESVGTFNSMVQQILYPPDYEPLHSTSITHA
jgi:hypothetical protein